MAVASTAVDRRIDAVMEVTRMESVPIPFRPYFFSLREDGQLHMPSKLA